ncbi:MAG: hypothetical protein M3159_07635 [Actinomycetota bacterium]|nr:hypothetical protein [Actinomycetota bacterium]
MAPSLGADAVEIDIRLTSDGVPVLNHDRTFWRMACSPLPVDRTSAERFAKLRERKSGAPMPSLAEVLDVLPEGIDLALDLKAPEAFEPAADLLARRALLKRSAFWMRDETFVRKAAVVAPDTERALLRNTYTPAKTSRYLQDAIDCGATAVSIHQRGLTYEAVWDSLAKGLTTYCWVIELGDLPRVVDTGVHGIVVDSPDLARQILS